MKTDSPLSGTTRRLVVQQLTPVRFALLALIALVVSACTPTGYSPQVGVPTRAVVEISTGEPAISISPTSGSAGVYVQITGEHWPVGSLVLIALRDERGRSGIRSPRVLGRVERFKLTSLRAPRRSAAEPEAASCVTASAALSARAVCRATVPPASPSGSAARCLTAGAGGSARTN